MSDYTYLFSFTPLDSFSFSGENSARTKGIVDPFLKGAHNAARRQSFRVETDAMPPQTTLMGAVRRVFFGTNIGIGSKSFNIADDAPQDMGDISSISAVFLKGKNKNGEEVYCFPAPFATMKFEKNQVVYAPAQPDLYHAKNGTTRGFLVYRKNSLHQMPQWHDADDFMKIYEQPVVHIGDNNQTDGYHLQCKCRFKSEPFSDLAFCIVVSLKKQPANPIKPMLIALGSRDGRFMAEAEQTRFSPTELSDILSWHGKQDFWCVSLLSAALLPKAWRETEGLKQAFVETRNMRCALSDAKFALQLIPEKMVFAEKGSVFLFDSAEHRSKFIQAVQADERSICGLNQILSYQIIRN